MKYLSPLLLIIFTLQLASCSNPISRDVRYDNITFDAQKRRTMVSAINPDDQSKIVELTAAIMDLGPDIDIKEASFVAREAVLFPRHLANQYRLVASPNSHNVLVNAGKRERGLCYHWAIDMTAHMVKGRTFKTLSLQRAVANQGRSFEHNVLTVAAKGDGVEDAYILDAWRDSSDLYWVKTYEDPNYLWTKYYPRTNKVNLEKTASKKVNSEKVN